MKNVKTLNKQDYDTLCELLDARRKSVEYHNETSCVTRTLAEAIDRNRKFKKEQADFNAKIEVLLQEDAA